MVYLLMNVEVFQWDTSADVTSQVTLFVCTCTCTFTFTMLGLLEWLDLVQCVDHMQLAWTRQEWTQAAGSAAHYWH
jgi:hypothetical protein